ncbi:hypothetical protein V5F29_05370 [Xanthobacter aminoxidans]|uniref:hypothetical protein n=1 Tax=Xanthobacter aminoxidans TaxID=186280 RepID=UPI00372752A4
MKARLRRGLLALFTVLLLPRAAEAEEAPPGEGEVNTAMARSADYRGTKVTRIKGCFPAVSEDGVSDPRHEDWYCGAEGTPLPSDAPFLEFAIRRKRGPRGFEMLIGELGGGCPKAKTLAHDLGPLVTRMGVVGLFDDDRATMGSLNTGGPDGSLVLACAYLGRLGKNHYQITVSFNYDAQGYHLRPGAQEEVFDADGNAVDASK